MRSSHDAHDPADDEDLEDLFESAPCGYLSARADGRIIKVNRTFVDWTGHPHDQLVGRRFIDLLTLPGRIFYETHFAPLLRMQGFFHEVALDLECQGRGRLPCLVNAVERRGPDGELRFVRITVFRAEDRRSYEQELLAAREAARQASDELRDLNAVLETRIAQAVEERLSAEEALRHAQKLETIGQLTGGVAHDFNNLLTVIIGGLDMIERQAGLLEDGPAVARIRRSADMAMQGAKRAAILTARLLAFARRQPLAPKPLDVNRLVIGLADLLQRTMGDAIALETVSAAGLWQTLADPNELENALVNLAVNARDAMPEGGRLTIETGNASLDEAYVQAMGEPVPPGQYVLLAVSDTGCGMDKATLDHVFEPFFTTKEAGRGTGLGLSQVYGFVRQSGGHVRIYSEPGQGTTVKAYLPRLLGAAAPDERPAAAPLGGLRGGRETVLVVEDHADLRAYGVQVLQELGYRVLEAGDGPAALELLAAHPEIDLLFTDVVLPGGMNGRQLADAARQTRPLLKVLFTTGYTRNAIVHHGRLDPGVNLLGKPFTQMELAAKIRGALDG
ncbi:PAS domain-containing hybrid sensor histidine kinase/response regulator [Geminicoccus roseus]|uniref:PAS domain-containing hybrid sensor histidine kinase/response regulator n=1 Tax=Geminicoccus roseus TaxID=404900 RepID=UPI0003FA5BF0|nr:PAS domain-containing hybrid sensor histidine kinase/response regulator [Geminicoccus roseus]